MRAGCEKRSRSYAPGHVSGRLRQRRVSCAGRAVIRARYLDATSREAQKPASIRGEASSKSSHVCRAEHCCDQHQQHWRRRRSISPPRGAGHTAPSKGERARPSRRWCDGCFITKDKGIPYALQKAWLNWRGGEMSSARAPASDACCADNTVELIALLIVACWPVSIVIPLVPRFVQRRPACLATVYRIAGFTSRSVLLDASLGHRHWFAPVLHGIGDGHGRNSRHWSRDCGHDGTTRRPSARRAAIR
jgi:hypothetical protein